MIDLLVILSFADSGGCPLLVRRPAFMSAHDTESQPAADTVTSTGMGHRKTLCLQEEIHVYYSFYVTINVLLFELSDA